MIFKENIYPLNELSLLRGRNFLFPDAGYVFFKFLFAEKGNKWLKGKKWTCEKNN